MAASVKLELFVPRDPEQAPLGTGLKGRCVWPSCEVSSDLGGRFRRIIDHISGGGNGVTIRVMVTSLLILTAMTGSNLVRLSTPSSRVRFLV